MGLEHPAVLDAFAHDKRRDALILAMYKTRPWTGDESHILQLQEKLNAYASFILDGEMAESFPQFVGKPIEIQLRHAAINPIRSRWDFWIERKTNSPSNKSTSKPFASTPPRNSNQIPTPLIPAAAVTRGCGS
jgi:hypothetical protein